MLASDAGIIVYDRVSKNCPAEAQAAMPSSSSSCSGVGITKWKLIMIALSTVENAEKKKIITLGFSRPRTQRFNQRSLMLAVIPCAHQRIRLFDIHRALQVKPPGERLNPRWNLVLVVEAQAQRVLIKYHTAKRIGRQFLTHHTFEVRVRQAQLKEIRNKR